MPALLERLDEVVLSFRKDAGEDREILGAYAVGDGSGWETAPSRPTARATIAAVAGASPVTMTVRTPNVRNSVMSAAESARGGSLRAMIPASFTARGGPTATASTRKPLASSWLAIVDASGEACAKADDGRKGPLHDTHRGAARIHRRGLGHLRGRIEGHKFAQFGQIGAVAFAAAERMAASTGSCPPSELARAAIPRTCDSSKPGIGWMAVTLSSFSVSVPVLSAHRTSMLAASSTAESRVGRTPSWARARAPIAAARVKVAGSATGIDARTAVSTRGMISLHRHFEGVGIPHQQHDEDAIEHGEIAHHAQNSLLLRAFDMRGANQFRRAPELCARLRWP